MKTQLLLMAAMCLIPSLSFGQAVSYMEEVKALGSVAGQGLACNAKKYDTYEMLARAILITKAVNDQNQADGMYTYNESKANAYFSKQMDGFYLCNEVAHRFDNQDIFKSVLYADGSIKLPDGRIFNPRQAYDATILYDKNAKEREKAQAIYDKGDKVQVGEIRIKTDGNDKEIKAIYPGVKTKVEPVAKAMPQPVRQPQARQVQVRQPVAYSAPPASSAGQTVKHIKNNRR